MPTRRSVVAGLAAAASWPGATWADAGSPTHLSAARDPDESYALYGLREDGTLAFRVPLPDRGHAAAVHPVAPEAVAFARRPGTFALVLDCIDGQVLRRLVAPEGRHFYGHGAFSAEGELLFTTENAIETGEGRIGIWSRSEGYRRVGEFASGGIGPHEIVRIPDTDTLAIANGGIRTHPATGREKLNLETMRPNLTLATETGAVLQHVTVPEELSQNSLRHLAARADGVVACAFQWQGDVYEAPPLLALYTGEDRLAFVEFDMATVRALVGYAGSVAFSQASDDVAITSPRGGLLVTYHLPTRQTTILRQADVCGISASASGLMATDGQGSVHVLASQRVRVATHALAFDNHLVRVAA
ncbi:MAG: DUF1513 domain-containing protein [Pseudomonadota bacterium]